MQYAVINKCIEQVSRSLSRQQRFDNVNHDIPLTKSYYYGFHFEFVFQKMQLKHGLKQYDCNSSAWMVKFIFCKRVIWIHKIG